MKEKEKVGGLTRVVIIGNQGLYRENNGLSVLDNNGVIGDFQMKLLFHNSNFLLTVLMDID